MTCPECHLDPPHWKISETPASMETHVCQGCKHKIVKPFNPPEYTYFKSDLRSGAPTRQVF